MLTGFVADQIRRTNRNLLVVNVLVLVVALAIPLLASGYLAECIGGPYPTDLEHLGSYGVASDAPHRFIRLAVNPDDLDPHYYHITGGDSNKNDYYLFLHLRGGRYLIIKSSSEQIGGELVGSISDFSSDVRDKVIDGIRGTINGHPADIVLSLDSYRAGMWIMLIFVPLLLAFAGWNIAKAIRRMGNPLTHPIARQLAHIGPPEEIAVAVDAEFSTSAQRTGHVITTVSWLARPFFFGCRLVYLGDVVWAYKKQTKKRINGIPAGSTYALVLHEASGRAPSFTLSAAQTDRLLAELSQRVPWAIIGYSQQLAVAWAKQRQQFLNTVAERKTQHTASPQPPAPTA